MRVAANTLTEKQAEIVALAVSGLQDKEIARRLYLSTTAVSTRWRCLMRRFGCTSRSQLIATLVGYGLVE